MRAILKKILPAPIVDLLRRLRERLRRAARSLRPWLVVSDYRAMMAFILRPLPHASFLQRVSIVLRSCWISLRVECPHTQQEVLSYAQAILSIPRDVEGVVVEAGCFKGGSTAKFSRAAELAGRELIVFDSFQGIPANEEPHKETIFGQRARFEEGSYCGPLDEVQKNVTKYGKIECCRFIQGWFDETMPHFHESVAAAYVDVDLASSTRTCLKYLFPLLRPGGELFSQDGHLPLVIDVIDDDAFWEKEVGCPKPQIIGLNTSKLVRILKHNPVRV
jgi:O-methyltransferase